MSESFDPYHRWLGIPPKDQPPNHYRLLGVDPFESNLDVIEAAADRQMGHLRTYQTGKHATLSQQLLNEVAAAKICLLNRDKKAAYDFALRGRLSAEGVRVATVQMAPSMPAVAERRVTPVPTPPAPPVPPPVIVTRVKGSPRRLMVIGSTVAGALILVGIGVWAMRGNDPAGTSASKSRGRALPAPTSASKAARPAPSHGHTAAASKPSRSVDLLEIVDIARDTRRESGWLPWRSERGELVMPPGNAQLEIPYSMPAEYDLTVTVKRESATAQGPFVLMPVAGGTTFQIRFDSDATRGLTVANFDNRPLLITGRAMFQGTRYSTIICRVRRTGFSITVNGQLVADRKDPYSRYSPDPAFLPRDPSHPMLVSFTPATFRIGAIELTPVGP